MSKLGDVLPVNFRRIRLELAREPGHPTGDAHIGYTLVAPLDREGMLDSEAALTFKHHCTVVRFHEGEESQRGLLRRRPGGSWAFHYELGDGAQDDDAGYRLGARHFAPGEYVSIDEDEGRHTYRVVSVEGV